ncbi:MAG TPA: LamG-like jellyroll fold domain-containing protein [Actinoplanes sp.]
MAGEPIFNLNDTARRPVVTNPGNQTGNVGAPVNLQLTATSSAPPVAWTFAGLPPGVTANGGLLTGTLPATAGTYTVTASARDSLGLAGSTSFNWTVIDPTYSTMVMKDQPWAYYRLGEATSPAATSVATDSSGNNRPGVHAGASNGTATWWPLDEPSGTVTADVSGAANPGTLVNAPARINGVRGPGLSFNGSNTYVQGTRAAVHTNRDFTVTAWAYLAAGGGANRAVVTQSGTTSYGFSLRYDGGNSRWGFATANSDTTSPTVTKALSASPSVVGRWTHLAGVFDASANKSTIYVDGVAGGSVTRSAGWNARGSLHVGTGQWNGSLSDFFNGRVDDVRTYQRALPAGDIAKIAADTVALRWDFSEGTGSTTADLAGGENPGTFGSAAGWAGPGHVGTGASFTGNATNGYVASATGSVRTNASLTVSSWVYLTSSGVTRTAVSQAGTNVSGFYLQYHGALNRWVFTMPWQDATTSSGDLVQSTVVPALNTWVHLAGVYDATAGTIRLYVNGADQGSVAHTAAHTFDATGPTEVGRARFGGPSDGWTGSIDSVRAYQRVLSATDIAALSTETDPDPLLPDADMTAGVPGALGGEESNTTAVAFAGGSNGYSNTSMTAPMVYTVELWFRATGTRGGVLAGFYANRTGPSGARDRQVYLDSGGRLTYGTYPSSSSITVRSLAAYNDGNWHHVAASLGPAGIKLHVDGALVASNATTTTAGNFTGYWRWGSGDTTLWPNRPGSDYLVGSIDELAVYTKQLTDAQVAAHYQANEVSGNTSLYRSTVLGSTGLVSYWRLGESSGTAMTDSEPTTPNHGTYTNAPTLGVTGAVGGDTNTAATFNGTNQYATVARQIQDDFSIEFLFRSTGGRNGSAWAYGSGMVDADTVGTTDDFGVTLRADGMVMAGIGTTGGSDVTITSSSGGYNDDTWHHVVFTRTKTSGAIRLYIDGALVASGTGGTRSLTSTAALNIGRTANGSYYFAGSLDEVAVYNAVLTDTLVATHNARR